MGPVKKLNRISKKNNIQMGIKKVDDAWKNNSNRIEKISKERSKRYKGSISKND